MRPIAVIASWVDRIWDPADEGGFCETPWRRGEWTGGVVERVGTDEYRSEHPIDDKEYRAEHIARVIAASDRCWLHDRWWDPDAMLDHDDAVGVALMTDGRYMSWVSDRDVSGSGFHRYAVGGCANIYISATAAYSLAFRSELDRAKLRWNLDDAQWDLAGVLYDMHEAKSPFASLIATATESGEFGDSAIVISSLVRALVREWDLRKQVQAKAQNAARGM